jgi:hypothetical protein
MNKKEFERKLQMANLHGKKIAVCWRIYSVLILRRGMTEQLSKANLMHLSGITNWQLMLKRLADMVRIGIITDTWELVE